MIYGKIPFLVSRSCCANSRKCKHAHWKVAYVQYVTVKLVTEFALAVAVIAITWK